MTPDGILETALYVTDLDAAADFYGGVLGLQEIGRVEQRHIFYRCGDGVLLLFDGKATHVPSTNPDMPVPTHGAFGEGHVCFRADQQALDIWRSRFNDADIEIEADFCWPNGARSIYVRDPSGNSVEFAEPKLWGLE